MATPEQRQRFAEALQRARRECGLSQRDLGAALNVSQASVSQWLTGQSAPKVERIGDLERVLRLPPNTLARQLGYVPSDQAEQKPVMTVAEAAEADPRLSDREQRILAAVYRELVQQDESEVGGPRPATG